MSLSKILFFMISLFGLSAFSSGEGVLALYGLDGKAYTVPATGARATLLIFISSECPICNRYAPEISRISAKYRSKGLSTFVVYVDQDASAQSERKHSADFKLPAGFRDAHHGFVKDFQVTATPEAVVLGSQLGQVLYKGRIDDLYVQVGVSRAVARTHDLRSAIEAILSGRKVKNPRTQPVGCWISGT